MITGPLDGEGEVVITCSDRHPRRQAEQLDRVVDRLARSRRTAIIDTRRLSGRDPSRRSTNHAHLAFAAALTHGLRVGGHVRRLVKKSSQRDQRISSICVVACGLRCGEGQRCGIACGQRRAGDLRAAARRARETGPLCRRDAAGLRAHRAQCVAVGAARRASRCDHRGAGRRPGPSRKATLARPVVSGRGAVCRARTRCAGQATSATSAAWSVASSRPRPAAMVLTARSTLPAAVAKMVGSACDQPAT